MKRAVRAGVDSIEHGTLMDDEIMRMMRAKGIYLVPTISAGRWVAEKAQDQTCFPPLVRPKALELGPVIQETFAKAWRAGVPIMFGTGCAVCEHGRSAREFAPLSLALMEDFLKERTRQKAPERRLAAQLAGGCPGIALQLDLAESQRLRREVLRLIELAAEGKSFGQVFAQTAQLAKNERERFENILELFYSIFHDLLELSHGPQEQALRNPDLKRELEALSQRFSLEWVQKDVGELDLLHGRLRRNINRQLGLDALAVSLGSR